MNPTSASDAMYINEIRAKGHWQNILYVMAILGDNSTSQEITDEVIKKVTLEIEHKFDPSLPQNMDKDKEKLEQDKKRELEFRKLSRKTTDKYLSRMVKKCWVKTKHHVYSLTPEGRNEKIFGQYYGQVLYEKLMKMPFRGSIGEKLEEYVKRVGIFVTYVFMRNSNRSGLGCEHSYAREEEDEWINDSISPVLLFEWFNNVFYSKSKSNDYEKLKNAFGDEFARYIHDLEESEKMYYEKIFPFLHQRSELMLGKRDENRSDYS